MSPRNRQLCIVIPIYFRGQIEVNGLIHTSGEELLVSAIDARDLATLSISVVFKFSVCVVTMARSFAISSTFSSVTLVCKIRNHDIV